VAAPSPGSTVEEEEGETVTQAVGAATFEVTAISKVAASVPTATPKLAGFSSEGG
jgi:hypothetical protein